VSIKTGGTEKKTFNNEQVNDGIYYYVLEVFNKASSQIEEYTGEIHIFISNSSSSNNNKKNDEFDIFDDE
jgi:uncharacterized protein YtpQ (UPF0354 family)